MSTTKEKMNMDLNIEPVIDHPLKPQIKDKQEFKSNEEEEKSYDDVITEMDSKKSEWTCPKCTFLNSLNNITCAICYAQRPLQNGTYKSSLNTIEETKDECKNINDDDEMETIDWQCKICTFINRPFMINCEMCQAPKPCKNINELSIQIPKESELTGLLSDSSFDPSKRCKIALRGHHGRYLCASSGMAKSMSLRDHQQPIDWEIFEVIPIGKNKIALKTHWGNYVTAHIHGMLHGDATVLKEWEIFTVSQRGNKWAFKSHHGQWLSAQLDRNIKINANAVQEWELFNVIVFESSSEFHGSSDPNYPSPIIDYDADSDDNNDWMCSLCNTLNGDHLSRCKNCANNRDKMVWKRKTRQLESNDWKCGVCGFMNAWSKTGQIQDIACCLECGTPNMDDMIPELEDVRDCTVKCQQCGIILQSESDLCYQCTSQKNMDIDDDGNNNNDNVQVTQCAWKCLKCQTMNSLTRISCRRTWCGNKRSLSVDRKYKYNELTGDQQRILVKGYWRQFGTIDCEHSLWDECVVWCFMCYVGRDYFNFCEDFYFDFIGNVVTCDNYIYCWRIKVSENKNKNGEMHELMIGLAECDNLEVLKYAIESNGSKYGFGNALYCRPYTFGDVITVRYDKRRMQLSFGVNDEWYGIAFEGVLRSNYQIVARSEHMRSTPVVKLIDFHWTKK